MIRKTYSPSVVSTERLKQHGLDWKVINYPYEVLVRIPSSTPHAIVRDEKGEDIGVIQYLERNGLPYAEFDYPVEYLFIRMGVLLRTSPPRRMN